MEHYGMVVESLAVFDAILYPRLACSQGGSIELPFEIRKS